MFLKRARSSWWWNNLLSQERNLPGNGMEGNSYSSLGTYGDMVSMNVVSIQLPSVVYM